MNRTESAIFRSRAIPAALLVIVLGSAWVIPLARADSASPGTRPVTATPPLQVVPATPVSHNVQQRMRACNSAADARKLAAAARETFIRSCMAPHHSHAILRPGSQAKADP